MAVPVRGSKLIFEAVLKTFAGIDYLSEPNNIDHYSSVERVLRAMEAVS
jgi:hypothetical protein